MIRGTTPDLIFTLPFEVKTIQTLWITFYQAGKEVFTLDNESCDLTDNKVTIRLSQEQTLQLVSNSYVEIQLRVLNTNNVAMASNILKVPVQRILKGGVI